MTSRIKINNSDKRRGLKKKNKLLIEMGPQKGEKNWKIDLSRGPQDTYFISIKLCRIGPHAQGVICNIEP